MLAVMLRADGWRVELLGADTPIDAAIAFAGRIGATMLCVSATRSESLAQLRAALAATPTPHGMTVVVGGAALTPAVARSSSARRTPATRLDGAVERLRKLSPG